LPVVAQGLQILMRLQYVPSSEISIQCTYIWDVALSLRQFGEVETPKTAPSGLYTCKR
jgi:hypothetical protein